MQRADRKRATMLAVRAPGRIPREFLDPVTGAHAAVEYMLLSRRDYDGPAHARVRPQVLCTRPFSLAQGAHRWPEHSASPPFGNAKRGIHDRTYQRPTVSVHACACSRISEVPQRGHLGLPHNPAAHQYGRPNLRALKVSSVGVTAGWYAKRPPSSVTASASAMVARCFGG